MGEGGRQQAWPEVRAGVVRVSAGQAGEGVSMAEGGGRQLIGDDEGPVRNERGRSVTARTTSGVQNRPPLAQEDVLLTTCTSGEVVVGGKLYLYFFFFFF